MNRLKECAKQNEVDFTSNVFYIIKVVLIWNSSQIIVSVQLLHRPHIGIKRLWKLQ